MLARALYDDVAWRSAGDIDILVAVGDLAGAIEVVEAMGWSWQRSPDRPGRLPVLHEILTHSTMPRVELHWRVHCYEERFAADALERAERPDVGAQLRMLRRGPTAGRRGDCGGVRPRPGAIEADLVAFCRDLLDRGLLDAADT